MLIFSVIADSNRINFAQQDNLGGEDSFIPVCAYNDDYALHNEISGNASDTEIVIRTAAFKMDFVFATNVDWLNQTDDEEPFWRNLRGNNNVCSPKGNQECCSADAFNGLSKDEKKEKKAYCKSIGCKNCSMKRRRLRRGFRHTFGPLQVDVDSPTTSVSIHRSMIDDDLYGTDFNDALKQYTALDPNSTGAVLNATNVEDLAVCRASNYNVTEYETPSLGCREYLKYDCEANDYIIVQSNDTNATEVCLPEVRCYWLVSTIVFIDEYSMILHILKANTISIHKSFSINQSHAK